MPLISAKIAIARMINRLDNTVVSYRHNPKPLTKPLYCLMVKAVGRNAVFSRESLKRSSVKELYLV